MGISNKAGVVIRGGKGLVKLHGFSVCEAPCRVSCGLSLLPPPGSASTP